MLEKTFVYFNQRENQMLEENNEMLFTVTARRLSFRSKIQKLSNNSVKITILIFEGKTTNGLVN